MLVLSRKRGEEIIIDDQIVVKVLEIRGSQVRIGVEAPKEVRVMRGDLENAQPAASGRPVRKTLRCERIDLRVQEQSPNWQNNWVDVGGEA